MPYDNRFRHQRYDESPSADHHQLMTVEHLPDLESRESQEQLLHAGRTMRASGVRKIYLVHGTLAGTDVSGVYREITRVAPTLAGALGGTNKQLIDLFARDMGNYTEQYAKQLEEGINEPRQPQIHVKRFVWSSENHHTGRAVAALRLLVELVTESHDGRIMLWGHSHAGNVFALLTNLLGGDAEVRSLFLSCFGTWLERRDAAIWQQARSLFQRNTPVMLEHPLDIVTLGTPIRYGWEPRGYDHLLHMINHHSLGSPPETAPFPPTAEQLRHSAAGDYFQQFFIAGTNFPPGIWAWSQWRVERQFQNLVQAEVSSRSLVESLRYGRRIHADGQTLLIDYSPADPLARSLAGHAVYTRLNWLPFHAHQIAERLCK